MLPQPPVLLQVVGLDQGRLVDDGRGVEAPAADTEEGGEGPGEGSQKQHPHVGQLNSTQQVVCTWRALMYRVGTCMASQASGLV